MNNKLLIKPEDVKPSFRNWKIKGILNPAGIRLPNGKIMLYIRVAEQIDPRKGESIHCPIVVPGKGYKIGTEKINKLDIAGMGDHVIHLKNGTCRLTTLSHLRKVILNENGFDVEYIGNKPVFTGTPEEGQYGVEDPRIIKLEDQYAMSYVTVSVKEGVSTSLAVSEDLAYWQRKGIIFREQNKDVVIFPEKINGQFVVLHRPEGFFKFSRPSIWISYSPDLIYWGKEKSIIQPREDSWESERIGSGAPPVKTEQGWLEIYHGVKKVRGKNVYSAGATLLDLEDPEKILARSPENEPLFYPTEDYENSGFVNSVVFPTAAIIDLNKKDLLIYYGGADSVTAVKKIRLEDIFKHMQYY
ncbi:hypothetical protein LCGC14_1003750 [marine sediment metagenome]|uniref:Glycosidase n=1 Tax=marine sediment metagenome TaxID=412755 RepID=A0A0F9NNQ1_9ZZZZ